MDPITAAMLALTEALKLANKVYDATPQALKEQGAGDWAKIVHNVSEFLLAVQGKINAGVR